MVRNFIPNLFTLFNLLMGCMSLYFVFTQQYLIVFWLILFAAIADVLDGLVARLLKVSGDLGKQLDSLADVVSFGVAPGMIIYQFLRLSFAKDPSGVDTSLLWLVPAFILPCAAAWRLARFNLDTTQTYHFKGMPVPAVGLLVASLPMIYFYSTDQWMVDLLLNKWFLYGVVAVLSWLMVSTLPLMAMKFKDYSVKNNLPKYLLVVVAVIAALLLKWLAVPVIILAYVVLSLLFKNKIA